MKKKILISGAGGFIAGYLVKDFLADGHEVICVDNKPFENWFQYDNQYFVFTVYITGQDNLPYFSRIKCL